MSIRPFSGPGVWLRGNMHTHTTASYRCIHFPGHIDGYAAEGYDFLALTDHERVTNTSALNHRGLTMLPGTEISVGENDRGRPFHLVGVGMSAMPEFDSADAQGALDALAAVSQFTFIAHPSWSDVTFAHLLTLTGADAVEIFNTGCQREMGRGLDEIPWDDCLARGSRLLGVAVDDCHWKIPDAYGGWVMVWAEDRSQDAICAALRAGRYYSSSGPTIEDLEVDVEAGRVRVRCSPAAEVFAVCPHPGQGGTTWREGIPEEPITECEVTFAAGASPVRVVVVDEHGRRAWSNSS